jgi:hypothetical protein
MKRTRRGRQKFIPVLNYFQTRKTPESFTERTKEQPRPFVNQLTGNEKIMNDEWKLRV